MCDQIRCPGRGPLAAAAGSVIAVTAELRLQEPAGEPGHLPSSAGGRGRAGRCAGAVAGDQVAGDGQGHGRPVMVRLPVWLWFAGAAGFQELGEGWGLAELQPRSWSTTITYSGRPAGQRPGNGRSCGSLVSRLVLLPRPRIWDKRPSVPAAGTGFGRFPAGGGHWPASISRAGQGWLGGVGEPASPGWLRAWRAACSSWSSWTASWS